MGHLSKAGVLTVRLVQIPRSILGEGFELKDYKTPRDVTVGKKETVAFDSSNVEKNESLKGTCANCQRIRCQREINVHLGLPDS